MTSTTPVPTITTGDVWTATMHNTYIRSNMFSSAPAIFSNKGDLFVGWFAAAGATLSVGVANSRLHRWDSSIVGMMWTVRTPQCQIRASGAIDPQSIGDNTTTTMSFDQDFFDNTNLFYSGGNLITIPANYGGLYAIHAQCYFDGHATANKARTIGINCSVAGQFYQSVPSPSGGQPAWLSVSALVVLVAGETVSGSVFQISGGALNCRSKILGLARLQ